MFVILGGRYLSTEIWGFIVCDEGLMFWVKYPRATSEWLVHRAQSVI